MKREADALTLMRKEVGKEAAAILNKVDRMLKKDMEYTQIERALAAELWAHLRKQLRLFMWKNIPKVYP